MSDDFTSNGRGPQAVPPPPEEMVAQAAQILGYDEPTAGGPEHESFVLVTVAGPKTTKVVRVPTNVPAGRLAETLGGEVGVAVVARLSVRNGEVIHASQTLGEVGIRPGSVILVDEPGAPGLVSTTGTGTPDGLQQYWAKPRGSQSGGRNGSRTGRQWTILVASIVALVVVAMILGATLFGSSTTSTTTPNPLAVQAARAWLAGTPFTGPRSAGVPANLGRTGPKLPASLEVAGSSTSLGITSQQFIVAPVQGPAYGLTVVLYNGSVAYPLTVTGLPFANPVGTTVPQTGTIVGLSATKQANNWAVATFGPQAAGAVPTLGYRLDGSAKVLNQWKPGGKVAFVARINVPLSTTALGSTTAATQSFDTDAVANIKRQVTTDQAAISSADAAAQAAVTASQTAVPPNPAPLAAAAAAAQQAATNAQNTLTTDQQTENTDEAALAAAQKAESATKAVVASVYDVAFNAKGDAVSWVPADYMIGQS